MKILKGAALMLGGLFAVLAVLYLLRTDPIYMIAGKRLSGAEQPYPPDWSVCDAHTTVAVETRPDAPHSVTTLCFVHQDDLFIPAADGGSKDWTAYVVEDPRIRIKIGENIHLAKAERIEGLPFEEIAPSIIAKYPQLAERDPTDQPQDVWLFRIGPR